MPAEHELTDVDVDRVDAVDRPATRRKWLLLKSEEADEEMVNAEELAKAVESALEVLAKEEGDGLPLSEGAVGALNTLAKMIGFDATFKAAKKKKPDEEPAYAYGYPATEKEPAKKDEGDEESFAKAVLDELRGLRETLEKQAVQKSADRPASKQPDGEEKIAKSAPRKWGEGLFADVIFGQ